jgi:NAD(P)-dependent dehydrogenase (short-subunit alcohol dehydrogenase family)
MKICENRVVIICGTGGGGPRAYALARREGAKVVVSDINNGAGVVGEILGQGGSAVTPAADITRVTRRVVLRQTIENWRPERGGERHADLPRPHVRLQRGRLGFPWWPAP